MAEIDKKPGEAAAAGSPDELDNVLQITTPGVWMVVAACFFLLFGILMWAVFGTVSVGVHSLGEVRDGKLLCLVDKDEISEIRVGETAEVNGVVLTVEEMSAIPLSREEARKLVSSEYLVSENMNGDWVWSVILKPEEEGVFPDGTVLEVETETGRVSPISRIWRLSAS